MTKLEKSIEINASPEKIWSIMQWENLPEFQPEWKKVEWTSKDKNKVGSTLHMIGEVAGFKADMDVEITEWKENEKLAWRTSSGNTTGFGSFTLSPTKEGTKLTMVIEYELPYSILGKLIDKVRVHKAMDKSYDGYFKRLKDMGKNRTSMPRFL